MTTDTDKLAILGKYQCCYAELANSISVRLSKYKLCDLTDDIRKLKLARAFLYRIQKYDTSAGDDTLNEDVNCMTKEELCQILNAMYCILDEYCDC